MAQSDADKVMEIMDLYRARPQQMHNLSLGQWFVNGMKLLDEPRLYRAKTNDLAARYIMQYELYKLDLTALKKFNEISTSTSKE